jgi:tRNA (cmo5U34)-methyltransferase
MQKQRTIEGFNKIAPFYHAVSMICSLNRIHKSQMWLLSKKMNFSKTLIIGGGDGKFLIEAIKQGLSEQYYYVDLSDAMIKLAHGKIEKQLPLSLDSVVFICGSYQDIPNNQKFDLIITPYFLDCLSEGELSLVMAKLHAQLTVEGTWYFTDFNIPKDKTLNFIFKNIIQLLYRILNLFCDMGVNHLPDFNNEFCKYKFTLLHEEYFIGGLLVSRIYKSKIP